MGFSPYDPSIRAAVKNGLIPAADLASVHRTEDEFTRAVIALAQSRGWLAVHYYPAIVADGKWRTPVMGDNGFPDIIAARGGRIVVAELKVGRNPVSPEQREWLTRLEAGGAEMYVFRPEDWEEVEAVFL